MPKKNYLKLFMMGVAFSVCGPLVQAQSAASYIVTLTNGGNMPLSPSVVYVQSPQSSAAQMGRQPTPSFVKLCQTGNSNERATELRQTMGVTYVTQTMGVLMPGESQMVEVRVNDPRTQSIQIESMYGKSKDVCAAASVTSHSLYALRTHVSPEFVTRDVALQTGAFLDPVVMGSDGYPQKGVCDNARTAVDCLRELAVPNMTRPRIHVFSGYLPSVLNFLEMNYGSADVQTLQIPSSGALQVGVKLKH